MGFHATPHTHPHTWELWGLAKHYATRYMRSRKIDTLIGQNNMRKQRQKNVKQVKDKKLISYYQTFYWILLQYTSIPNYTIRKFNMRKIYTKKNRKKISEKKS